MSESAQSSASEAPSEPSLVKELETVPYEPLLPVEKRLIASCLILGVLLLGLLLWASTTFFPVGETVMRRQ